MSTFAGGPLLFRLEADALGVVAGGGQDEVGGARGAPLCEFVHPQFLTPQTAHARGQRTQIFFRRFAFLRLKSLVLLLLKSLAFLTALAIGFS